MMDRALWFVALVSLAVAFPPPAAHSQTVTGAIVGTVTDASGAVVPAARVTVINESTDARFDTTSSETGGFRLPFLAVGTYTLRVAASGFQTAVREGIIVRVDDNVRADVSLQLGRVEEQVTITGAATLLNTENASTGQVIENERIVNLPLNGRNFLQLAQLVADVNAGSWGSYNKNTSLAPAERGVSLSGDGQRDPNTTFLVDGANVRGGYFGSITLVPSVDSIQEFQMQTSAFTAQFGTSPVHINVATKSGSNELHGSLFEFHREAFLNARNFFATTSTSSLPWHQHNFGGSLGGPVFVPRIYNGRNKTFFFFSYEGIRVKTKSPQSVSVPPAAFRNGDFSQLLPATVVKDPLTGMAFPGNAIPTSRIAPQAQFLMPFWPLPTGSGLVNNFAGISPNVTRANDFITRIDHNLRQNDQLYARWAGTDPKLTTGVAGVGGNPNFSGVFSQGGQNLLVGETHGFGPRMFNEFRFAYNRSTYQAGPPDAANLASQLQWGGVTETIGMPVVAVSGFGALASQSPGGYRQQTYQVSDNLSTVRGPHGIAAGLDIFRFMNDPQLPGGFQLPALRATATFAGTYTGYPFADFLLGIPYTGNQTSNRAGYASPAMSVRYPDLNFYVQDDWKLSRRFTLNLGMRYELVPVLSSPEMRNFDFRTGQLTALGVATPFYDGAHKNFAPRVGFAWQPFHGGKTVIRAGYGWYYARAVTYGPAQLSSNPPAKTVASFINLPLTQPGPPAVTMATFLLNTSPAVQAGGGLNAIVSNFTPTPSTQIWSFDMQHQLPGGFLLDAGYKGSLTTHLDGVVDENTALPPGPGPVNPRRPYPAWGVINTFMSVFTANYNAGIVRVEKRMGKGISLLASYSRSKCLDQTGTPYGNSEEANGTLSPQDRTNFRAEKGRCGMDIPNRAVFSYTYQLPFGRGQALLNSGGVLDKFAGGWAISGITILQNGAPESVQTATDVSNTGAQFERPDALFNPNLPASQRTVKRWFNTSAFVNPPAIRFGNSGRTLINAPGTNNFDLSLMKDTAIRERMRLEFRAEFFNAFNHTQLGTPNSTMGGTFGVISSAGNPRQIQLALKLLF